MTLVSGAAGFRCASIIIWYIYQLSLIRHTVLLKLSQPMYMDKKIRKICLPIMRYQFPQSLDEDDGHEDILSNFISDRQFGRTVSCRHLAQKL